MSDKIVPIVYFASNEYAPYLYVSLNSMINYTSDALKYDIHILYTGLDQKHIARLEKLCKENIKITCIDINGILKEKNIEKSNVTETGWRLLLPELFPQYSDVLYVESNMLFLVDAAELFADAVNLEKKKENMIRDMKILHYIDEIKPWEHPEAPAADLFWEEARKTPYYEEILFRNLRGKGKAENELFKNHIFPFDKFPKDSRIALYGAGVVGNTLYAQNSIVNYVKIVLWVDKNYEIIEMPEPVYKPDMLLEQQAAYDYVLIAIDDPAVCSSVEKMLLEKGIPAEKIAWCKYSRN